MESEGLSTALRPQDAGRGQGQVEGWREPGCPSLGKWSMADIHHQLQAAVRLEAHRATRMSLEAQSHSAE